MAPIKFEEHIKESLEKRRIEPSSKSWDVLSSQLDDSSKKKSPIWLWMGVASSFAGLVFLATTFFNSTNNTVSTEHNIVETTVNEQDSKTKTTDSYKESKEATTIAEETTITPTINTNTKKFQRNLNLKLLKSMISLLTNLETLTLPNNLKKVQ